jgi:CRISPR-associated protein Csx17
MINKIRLPGCRPEPLIAYLKALGIFRLVAEQADHAARAAWEGDVFVLHTALSEAELLAFFQERYTPTPIVAPWNGEDFFKLRDIVKTYRPDKEPKGAEVFAAILKSKTERLASFRDAIHQALELMRGLNIEREKPKKKGQAATLKIPGKDLGTKEVKALFASSLRNQLDESVVNWMDAALILETKSGFSPLLGTGGTDGNLDFALNFAQRLLNIGFADDELVSESDGWLRNALFGEPAKDLMSVAIGQFDPGRAGGPNAGQGLSGDSRVNPWEYVLMLEGALLLAGSVTRRLDINAQEKASFPFTVNATAVGNGALNEGEDSRGEIWLPLWRNPAQLNEVRQVFAEGRAQVDKRQARNAVDFARAIAGLGIDRGLTGFTRYGFLKRSGKAYLAASLGRFETHTPAENASLLAQLDDWLDRFRRACAGDNAQPRFTAALRRLDEAVFAYCRFGDAVRFGEIVRALGGCEQALAFNPQKPGIIGHSKYTVSPIPLLSKEWLKAAQEDSAEFRVALALAAMRATGEVGALRTNLEVVSPTKWGWTWAEPQDRYATVWGGTDLPRNLQAVLERRLMDATRLGLKGLPLESRFSADADDITAFLAGQVDDDRLTEWLWGLMLIDVQNASWEDLTLTRSAPTPQPIPRAYALLKLLFLPEYHALRTEGDKPVKPEPSTLTHLRAGRLNAACETAARRLRASGYVPMPGPMSGRGARQMDYTLPGPMLARLPAALSIPISQPQRLASLVLRAAVAKDVFEEATW